MILHASSVAWQGRGVLILGPSGSGKSTLALELMAFGATLISDDRTEVARTADGLMARAPAPLAGFIEARGVGLLQAEHAPARLILAVDMAHMEPDRLPQNRHTSVHGWPLPLVLGRGQDHLAVAILQYLKGGRSS